MNNTEPVPSVKSAFRVADVVVVPDTVAAVKFVDTTSNLSVKGVSVY